MQREGDLSILIERLERLEELSSKTDEILRGDGESPGLVQRVRAIEELALSTKTLVRWAVAGALSGAGALIWSMARDFIVRAGT